MPANLSGAQALQDYWDRVARGQIFIIPVQCDSCTG